VRAGMLAVPSRAGARLPHTIFEIDAEVRGAVRDRNDAQYTMKTLRSRHTPHLNGWVRGRTLNDPLTNFSALC
jgi:hypothetical protein